MKKVLKPRARRGVRKAARSIARGGRVIKAPADVQLAAVTAERDDLDKDYGVLLSQHDELVVKLKASEEARGIAEDSAAHYKRLHAAAVEEMGRPDPWRWVFLVALVVSVFFMCGVGAAGFAYAVEVLSRF